MPESGNLHPPCNIFVETIITASRLVVAVRLPARAAPPGRTRGGSPRIADPPKVRLDPKNDHIRRSVAKVHTRLVEDGFQVVATHLRDVTTPAGTISIPLVVEEGGVQHPVFVTHEEYTDAHLTNVLRILAVVRASDQYRRSRVVIYAPAPLPPLLRHYLEDAPVALFETQCLLAGQPSGAGGPLPPFDELAERCRKLVDEFFHKPLDYMPGSLGLLDAMLPQFTVGGKPQMMDKTLLLLGSYLGQSLVKTLAGEWSRDPGEVLASTVAVEGAEESFYPFFVLRKALLEGKPTLREWYDGYALYHTHIKDHASALRVLPGVGAGAPLGEPVAAPGPSKEQVDALRRELEDET